MQEIPEYPPYQAEPTQWNNIVTVTLGELYEDKVYDPKDAAWKWNPYSDEQYDRVCQKFLDHYWTREIGILPPALWRRRYVNYFNEIMPKYSLAYKALESNPSILTRSDRYYKSRNIYSDFPATQLQADVQDFASNATDHEDETLDYMNYLDAVEGLRSYKDIDLIIIESAERLFTCFYSVNLNTY